MTDLANGPELPTPAPLQVDADEFRNRLKNTTCALICIVLGIYLLEKFAVFMQPLLIALFIGYLIFPLHRRLVAYGIPSLAAFGLILVLIAGVWTGVGWMVYYSFNSVNWEPYLANLNDVVRNFLAWLPLVPQEMAAQDVTDMLKSITLTQVAGPLQSALGTTVSVVTFLLVVVLYLLFLIAEKVTFPRRIDRAFSQERASHIMEVIDKINEAISHYIIIKTAMSFLTGVLAMAVLGIFQVDFLVMWGLLTFFLNFIPYLGSAITLPAPVVLTFLQYPDQPWRGVVVGILLLAVHQGTGQILEPRLMGSRLGVSPLLILVALSFWGVVWGVVGMVLAVPLLVVIKIVLQNIRETQPIAILMSNE